MRRILVASLTILLGVSLGVAYAQTSKLPKDDSYSTTGPVPPPGVVFQRATKALIPGKVISGVPEYLWHHGCGPTAAGMAIGYYDELGHKLVPGDPGTQTAAVNDAIASAEHYNDYALPLDTHGDIQPDRSEWPQGDEHQDNCVADYMRTSQSVLDMPYGWSRFSDVDDAFRGYVSQVSPWVSMSVQNLMWGDLTWDNFRAEIDADRPVVLLVDTTADGASDHFVTAIGYGDDDGTPMYACFDTWSFGTGWYEFTQRTVGQPWGIYGATFLHITTPALAPANNAVGVAAAALAVIILAAVYLNRRSPATQRSDYIGK
jgi:hypothetical protein